MEVFAFRVITLVTAPGFFRAKTGLVPRVCMGISSNFGLDYFRFGGFAVWATGLGIETRN